MGVFGIEVREEGRPLVVGRVLGVVDTQAVDGDPLRHMAGVSKVMLPVIRTTDQAGADGLAACRDKGAVTNHEFPLPGAPVVAAQVDEAPAVDGGVLHEKCPAADGIDAHVAECRVAYRRAEHSLMGIESRQLTSIKQEVLAEIRPHDTPAGAILDIVELAAVYKRNVQGA